MTNKKGGDKTASRLSLELLVLRGLALSLGFEGLVAANVDLDLLGLGFGLLGQADLQHAIVVVGVHLPSIHGAGQRERAGEDAILALHAAIVFFFLFFFDFALAMHSEGVAFNADINVFFLDARYIKLQSNS